MIEAPLEPASSDEPEVLAIDSQIPIDDAEAGEDALETGVAIGVAEVPNSSVAFDQAKTEAPASSPDEDPQSDPAHEDRAVPADEAETESATTAETEAGTGTEDQTAEPAVLVSADENGWAIVEVAGAPVGASLKIELAEAVGADVRLLRSVLPNARCEVGYSDELGMHPVIRIDDVSDGIYSFMGALFSSVEVATLTSYEGEALAQAWPAQDFGVMLFSAAAVGEQKWMDLGAKAFYDNYLTFHFTVDGHSAQCANPMRKQPSSGWYTVADPWSISTIQGWSVGQRWDEVRYTMYYGPDGPGYAFGKEHIWPRTNWNGAPASDEDIYIMQHILIADTAFSDGGSALYGCSDSFIDWVHWNVTGFDEVGNVITHDAAGRKIADGGVYGSWIPAPPDDFDVFMLYTGSATQYIIGMSYELDGAVELVKTSADHAATMDNPAYSLEGAVYELRGGDGSVVATLTTDAEGHAYAEGIPAGSYTLVEITAPRGFSTDAEAHAITVDTGQTTSIDVTDAPLLGGISLDKADAQLGSVSQGDATLAGACFEVTNAGDHAVAYDGGSCAPGQTVARMTTDESGHAELQGLPLGTYTVREVAAPQGYLLPQDWTRTVQIDSEKVVALEGDDRPSDEVVRGGLSLQKVDGTTLDPNPQGDASLAGARFEVRNGSTGPVVVDGKVVGAGEVALTLVTDASGVAATAADALPYGTYEVVEVAAPAGYLLPEDGRQVVQIRSADSIAACDDVFTDQVTRGAIDVEKVDAETGAGAPLGAATLEGTVFEVVNNSAGAIVVAETTYLPGDVVLKLETDAEGYAVSDPVLPYGTYAVRESQAPRGYTAGDGRVVNVEVRKDREVAHARDFGPVFSNQIKRGDLRFNKTDEGSMARMGAVAFLITSATTGESHLVVSDQNGSVDTASSWNAHTLRTNVNDAALNGDGTVDDALLDPEAGLWFCGGTGLTPEADDSLGALPYDSYHVEELRCAGNEGRVLVSFDVVITRDGVDLDMGSVDNKTETTLVPSIGTELTGDGGSHEVEAAEKVVLVDEVGYRDLEPGTYTLDLELVYADTGAAVTDAGGTPATGHTEFTALASSGIATVSVEVAAGELAGRDVVAFETLRSDGVEVAAHRELTDGLQTVHFSPKPQIRTTLVDRQTQGHEAYAGTAVLVDTVTYTGLTPGKTYTLYGVLHDRRTGLKVRDDRGGEVGTVVEFVPEAAEGSVDVVFEFDAHLLAGMTVVAFEELSLGKKEVAAHCDLTDEAQSVVFPGVSTTLTDGQGAKEVQPAASVTLVDVVAYTGLVPGQTYELTGLLVHKSTGKPVVHDGVSVASTFSFEPGAADGTVEMTFSLDATPYAGEQLVAFETLQRDGRVIATHMDLASPSQTVAVGTPPEPPAPPEEPPTPPDEPEKPRTPEEPPVPEKPAEPPVVEQPPVRLVRQIVRTGDMIEANKPLAIGLAVAATALLASGCVLVARYRRRHAG